MQLDESSPVRLFNESDWLGLAGAEPFADGSDPFIREIGRWTIVTDASGLSVITDDGDQYGYTSIPGMTPALGRAILTGLPTDFDPSQFGMTRTD